MIHPPIQGFIPKKYPEGSVTQWFGENPELYSRWGLAHHNGIDIVAPHGTPIMCVEAGVVAKVKLNPDGYGKYVRVLTETSEWVYAHLSKIHVVEGEKVEEGDVVGLMGNTGFVVSGATPWWEYNPYAGTHLHLGLRKVEDDPNGWSYPGSDRKIQILNYDNGVKGAVDYVERFTSAFSRREKMLTIISLLNTVIRLLKLNQK